MVRIAILHSAPRPTWSSRQLMKSFSELGAQPIYILWNYTSASISSRCPLRYHGKCLNVDAIIVRGLGRGLSVEKYMYRYAFLKTAESHGIAVVNPADALFLARDKFTSLRILHENGIPVPDTIVTEDPSEALREVERLGSAVLKPITGSLGLGSFMVDDTDTAYYVVNLLSSLNQPIYVQEYIEKKNNRDIRIFVVDGRAIASIYRIAPQGYWKTNIARGAKALPASPSSDILETAVRAASVLGLIYAGVDIVENNDGYVVIEVNASPLWRGLQAATGVNPAKELAQAVLQRIKK
ncbi:ATP-grasp domain-containing protein [Pyrodictium delaneyi]|uniref:30S ribosomal protein S6--L-glutamate ligase n=1 Tax=Pyrodictium delaneyi TaxID=1273541 RepID=A0A211YLY6_9CREN|nr:RimK family alpha-L-glutamate ligase [Pyrodictium delaneyi]OWJ54068.1 30S ribosomal protein S6--L-glutamate ligase [Pyrodictium delaneyi]